MLKRIAVVLVAGLAFMAMGGVAAAADPTCPSGQACTPKMPVTVPPTTTPTTTPTTPPVTVPPTTTPTTPPVYVPPVYVPPASPVVQAPAAQHVAAPVVTLPKTVKPLKKPVHHKSASVCVASSSGGFDYLWLLVALFVALFAYEWNEHRKTRVANAEAATTAS